MEGTITRENSIRTKLLRFAFIFLACFLIGFSFNTYTNAAGEPSVVSQEVTTTAAAPADESEGFFICFMVFVVLLVIIVVVIVASSTSAASAAVPTVFERNEE